MLVEEVSNPEASVEDNEGTEPATEEVDEDTIETTSEADENQEESKGDKQR